MKVDIDFIGAEETSKLTFYCDQFNTHRDANVAISIIQTFSADFNLDPEMEIEDIEAIIQRAKEMDSAEFSFFINEDEIEAFIPESEKED